MKKLISLLLVIVMVATMLPNVFAANEFVDVPADAYYHDPVYWAVGEGITNGMDATHFAPDNQCTRGQLITFLWRYMGSPEDWDETSSAISSLTDVPVNVFYEKPMKWAVWHGIITPSNGKVTPLDPVNRAMACTVMYRAAKASHSNTIATNGAIFSDVATIPTYAQIPMSWCLDNNLLNGKGTILAPADITTRAETVTFLYRLDKFLSCNNGNGHVLKSTKERTVASVNCKTPGYDEYKCTKCGEIIKKNWTIQAHNFSKEVLVSDATCTSAAKYRKDCSVCGAHGSSTYTKGSALSHDWSKVELVSDATYSTPTKYRFVCSHCGAKDSTRSLGKTITTTPNLSKSPYRTLSWSSSSPQSKVIYNSGGTKVTLTRKWFASAWCYIADIELPAGSYSKFKGVSTYNGSSINSISAFNKLSNLSNAIIMVNGDAEMNPGNLWGNVRGGVAYGSTVQAGTSAPAHYWNPSNGTFGRLSDLGIGSAPSVSTVKNKGITDTIRFYGTEWLKDGKLKDAASVRSGSDCDSSTYGSNNNRRQRTFMGFKKTGSTIHVYLVVADGLAYNNYSCSSYSRYANDKASYGLIAREEKILLGTLGCDYGFGLDGGGSTQMAVRSGGTVYQVNGPADPDRSAVRAVWDFFAFFK